MKAFANSSDSDLVVAGSQRIQAAVNNAIHLSMLSQLQLVEGTKLAALEIEHGPLNLTDCVHHKRTVSHDRLVDWLAT